MNNSREFFDFICSHIEDDPAQLLLHPSKLLSPSQLKDAALQITLRKKFKSKFPGIVLNPRFLFPDRSVAEQASGEMLAAFVASLIKDSDSVVDLTAGLGINTIAFSKVAQKVVSVELSQERASVLKYNLEVLGIKNVQVICADCRDWLESLDERLDVAYIDPARRDDAGNRSISLHAYSPDVCDLIPTIKNSFNRLLIKVSPLLDLSLVIKELPEISGFYIIDFHNECKELLLDLKFTENTRSVPFVKCVEIEPNGNVLIEEFCFENSSIAPEDLVSSPGEIGVDNIIYLPFPSIRKAKPISGLIRRFPEIRLVSPNTMLFSSKIKYEDFPGKKLKVIEILDKKKLGTLKGASCNVIARNYPMSSEEISRRYRLKPSGNRYIIAVGFSNKSKALFLCEIIS